MNNAKHTRRALLSSVVALVLCLTMLMGTTFAWFTDTAKVNVNTITSGTLTLKLTDDKGNDVENDMLYFVDKNGDPITTAYYWEPGCTYNLQTLTVENTGSLALKFKVVVTGINGDSMLNEVIDWTIKCAGETHAEGKEISLAPKGKTTFTVSGHMDEEANNDYQNKSIDGISITVYATQDTVEYDSETNQYDANAEYFNTYKAATSEELTAAFAKAEPNDVIEVADTFDGKVEIPATAKEITVEFKGDLVDGIVIADGATDITLVDADITSTNPDDVHVKLSNNHGTVTLKNCDFTGVAGFKKGHAISGGYGTNLVVENCTIANIGYGIQDTFSGYETLTVKNCTFENTISWAIMSQGTINSVTIDNCKFINCTNGIAKLTGMQANGTLNFTNNTLTGCGEHEPYGEIQLSNKTTCTLDFTNSTSNGLAYNPIK